MAQNRGVVQRCSAEVQCRGATQRCIAEVQCSGTVLSPKMMSFHFVNPNAGPGLAAAQGVKSQGQRLRLNWIRDSTRDGVHASRTPRCLRLSARQQRRAGTEGG